MEKKKTPQYAPPPRVGDVFDGPPIAIGHSKGKYVVAAIVDLGFYSNEPTYYKIVFRFWSRKNQRYAWEIVGADAIDFDIYRARKKTNKKDKVNECQVSSYDQRYGTSQQLHRASP